MGAVVGSAFVGSLVLNDITPSFSIQINGVDRTKQFVMSELSIQQVLGQPSTMSARCVGFVPIRGQEIRVTAFNGSGTVYFAGHILTVTVTQARASDRSSYVIQCQDYTWLIDRYARVTATFVDEGVNTVAARICQSFTNAGFVTGFIPSSLGNVTRLEFVEETPLGALQRLAETSDAYLTIGPERHVNIFQLPDHLPSNSLTLTDTSQNFAAFQRALDLTDVATQVTVRGGGSQVSSLTATSMTVIPVTDIRFYDQAGTVVVGPSKIDYVGRQVLTPAGAAVNLVSAYLGFALGTQFLGNQYGNITPSGPGNLTGVVLPRTLSVNETVDLLVTRVDSTAAATLSSALSYDLSYLGFTLGQQVLLNEASGIATFYYQDARLTATEADGVAQALLAAKGYGQDQIVFDTQDQFHATLAPYMVPGQVVAVNLTTPSSIAESYRVQQVDITPDGALSGDNIHFLRRVTLGTELRDQGVIRALGQTRIVRT